MSKRKRFSVGDVVEWRNGEYTIVSLDPVKLRATCPGYFRDFTCRCSEMRVADDWRASLKPNDEVEYYFENFWIHSHVHEVTPRGIMLQPTFTRTLLLSEPHRIRRARASIPVRFERPEHPVYSRFDQILVDGEWFVVDKCLALFVLTVDRHYIAYSRIAGRMSNPHSRLHIGSVPFEKECEFDDTLSIMDCTRKFRNCYRYAQHHLWRRPSAYNLDDMVSQAVDHGDTAGVQNLMACADYARTYEMACWFEWRWSAIPYLQFVFSKDKVDVYWTRCTPLSSSVMLRYVTPILAVFFKPVTLCLEPPVESPQLRDWQSEAVDQMCANEAVNTCSAFCDTVDTSSGPVMFSHYGGFLQRPLPYRYGGVLTAAAGLGKTWMVLDLVRRTGSKTLVVVPLRLLPHWSSVCRQMDVTHSVWHGQKKDDSGTVVLSTTRTLSRSVPPCDFDRLVLDEAQLVKAKSTAMRLLCNLDIAIRWYVSSQPRFKEVCMFLHVYPFCAGYQPEVDAAEIPCEVFVHTVVPLEVTDERYTMRYPACAAQLVLCPSDINVCRYDPRLLDPEKLHERVSVHRSTLENVQSRLSHKIDISKCPVCLDQIVKAMVTSCGHAVCADCGDKLVQLGSNCPMCRADMYPLTLVSESTEQTITINDRIYRERDTTPGNMQSVLEECAQGDTVYVTRSTVLQKALEGKGLGRILLFRDCVGIRLQCDTIVLVDQNFTPAQRKQIVDRVRGIEASSVRVVTIV